MPAVFSLALVALTLLWHVVLSEPGLLRGQMTEAQKRNIQRKNTLGLLPYSVASGGDA